MDMQKACEVQEAKCTGFVHSFWFWCVQAYYLNYTLLSEVVFRFGCSFVSLSNISKTPFLEHLCTMAFISSIKKNSIATTWDSFKASILPCKIRNQIHANFEKKKVPQAASGNFVQKWLSVRHMFSTIYVS